MPAPVSPTSPAGRCRCATRATLPSTTPCAARLALFDLSHMAEILVTGPEAAAALDYALAGKISAVGDRPGEVLAPALSGRRHHRRSRRLPHPREPLRRRRQRVATGSRRPGRSPPCRRVRRDRVRRERRPRADRRAGPGILLRSIEKLSRLETVKPVRDLAYYWSTLGTYHGNEIMVGAHRLHRRRRLRALCASGGSPTKLWHELMDGGRGVRHRSRRTRQPRHPAPRGGHAALRPRARARHLPRAGRPRPGRQPQEGGRLRRTRGQRGRTARGRARARRPRLRGQARRPCRVPAVYSADDREVGVDHQRRAVSDARLPDRDGLRRSRRVEAGTELYIDVRGTRIRGIRHRLALLQATQAESARAQHTPRHQTHTDK